MPVQVKICGINSAAAADAVLRAGADFGGLVFFAKSPRHLSLEQGMALAERMRGRLRLAALVVDDNDAALAAIASQVKPDFFQLHGKETPERAAEIRARFGIPVIKAIAVSEAGDLAKVSAYDDVAEMVLFDAVPAADASRPGGHGAAFDWRILNGRSFGRPWFLAGGLNPENIGRAVAVSGAKMVDVSSGVESAPGVKSSDRIADFVAAAKQTVRA
ncbi:MAG: phosphoribosylanthranilate isomerase [Proteobacteria bacterium]|nr:phosphoribosylanthranilate isomerase [Pseudomonadota bacterium]